MKKWFLIRTLSLAAMFVMLAGVALGRPLAETNQAPGIKIEPLKPGGVMTNEARVFKGELRAGVMAIGGESTGFQLRTDEGRFELKAASKELKKQMTELNGKKVVVTGSLTIRKGVEKPIRQIVTVTKVKAQE